MTLTLIQKFAKSKNERKIKIKLKAGKWEHFKEKLSFSQLRSPTSFEFISHETLATGHQINVKKLRFKNCG